MVHSLSCLTIGWEWLDFLVRLLTDYYKWFLLIFLIALCEEQLSLDLQLVVDSEPCGEWLIFNKSQDYLNVINNHRYTTRTFLSLSKALFRMLAELLEWNPENTKFPAHRLLSPKHLNLMQLDYSTPLFVWDPAMRGLSDGDGSATETEWRKTPPHSFFQYDWISIPTLLNNEMYISWWMK